MKEALAYVKKGVCVDTYSLQSGSISNKIVSGPWVFVPLSPWGWRDRDWWWLGTLTTADAWNGQNPIQGKKERKKVSVIQISGFLFLPRSGLMSGESKCHLSFKPFLFAFFFFFFWVLQRDTRPCISTRFSRVRRRCVVRLAFML